MKILLAMSGGIDSSVVAHMLCEQGHDVIGVRFTLWIDPLAPALAQILPSKCCTTQNIHRADLVSKKLSIPLHIINLEQEFKETVVDPYLDAHTKGLTPNPCIGCNRTIKFGKLIALMREFGCEKLATGHYVRTMQDSQGDVHLLEAKDRRKDQSYYLYGIEKDVLPLLLFPLGDLEKKQVYELAQHYDVPLPESYKESQDLCFFPEKKPQAFLQRHLKDALQSGDIIDRTGKKRGEHAGIALYTIGQRHGLKIGGLKIPLEVVEKDAEKNAIIVAEKGRETIHTLFLRDVRLLRSMPSSFRSECRLRSLSPKRSGVCTLLPDGRATYVFDDRLPRQSPGQSLVFYESGEVLGGGVIEFQE